MRLRKFYGRTLEEAAASVKAELGGEALIVETRTVRSGSSERRRHPLATVEITAAFEGAVATNFSDSLPSPASGAVLKDLALLKQQIRTLLNDSSPRPIDVRDRDDLADYRHLIDRGVDPSILAGAFRRWLEWRASEADCAARADSIGARMKGRGLREWLWIEWTDRLEARNRSIVELRSSRPTIGVVGGSGVGKSTVLAKMASKIRLHDKKSVAIVTLRADGRGLDDPWRRWSRLMDVRHIELAKPEDARRCLASLERFDWVGIDTAGGMNADAPAGRAYGSLLAACPHMRTVCVLDARSRDRDNRDLMDDMRPFEPSRLVFSKIDEASQRGGLINLSFDGREPIEGLSTGRRTPEDLEEATPEALWRWVFEATGRSKLESANAQGAR
jgi:flagellar biosynthesis protein FlhF